MPLLDWSYCSPNVLELPQSGAKPSMWNIPKNMGSKSFQNTINSKCCALSMVSWDARHPHSYALMAFKLPGYVLPLPHTICPALMHTVPIQFNLARIMHIDSKILIELLQLQPFCWIYPITNFSQRYIFSRVAQANTFIVLNVGGHGLCFKGAILWCRPGMFHHTFQVPCEIVKWFWKMHGRSMVIHSWCFVEKSHYW